MCNFVHGYGRPIYGPEALEWVIRLFETEFGKLDIGGVTGSWTMRAGERIGIIRRSAFLEESMRRKAREQFVGPETHD